MPPFDDELPEEEPPEELALFSPIKYAKSLIVFIYFVIVVNLTDKFSETSIGLYVIEDNRSFIKLLS